MISAANAAKIVKAQDEATRLSSYKRETSERDPMLVQSYQGVAQLGLRRYVWDVVFGGSNPSTLTMGPNGPRP